MYVRMPTTAENIAPSQIVFVSFLSIARGTYMALNKPNPWNSPQFMQKCNDILVFCVHFNTDIYSNTKEKEILKHRFTLELFSVGR